MKPILRQWLKQHFIEWPRGKKYKKLYNFTHWKVIIFPLVFLFRYFTNWDDEVLRRSFRFASEKTSGLFLYYPLGMFFQYNWCLDKNTTTNSSLPCRECFQKEPRKLQNPVLCVSHTEASVLWFSSCKPKSINLTFVFYYTRQQMSVLQAKMIPASSNTTCHTLCCSLWKNEDSCVLFLFQGLSLLQSSRIGSRTG